MKTTKFKYTTLTEEDCELNLFMTVVGMSNIGQGKILPPNQGHPSDYWFNTDQRRVLQEYQIVYITEGAGVFQNRHKVYRITPGSVFVLFPGEWHRYRPLRSTGWKSHYIGLNGDMAKILFKSPYFSPDNPIQNISINGEVLETFDKILSMTLSEKPGYHQICIGLLIAYINQIIAQIRYKEFEGKEIEVKIREARYILNKRINEDVDAKLLAEELNMGYSYFRKMFTKYTGMPPIQYHLQLRIKQAEIMLTSSNKTVKEISYYLGFESAFYFSRVFKEKTNMSPVDFRKIHTV
jgi:AraC-like DNA-binding protein